MGLRRLVRFGAMTRLREEAPEFTREKRSPLGPGEGRIIPVLSIGLCLLLLGSPAGAGPRRCGDDVDGRGRSIPCACGDVLVGSRTLGAKDPITREVCEGVGLLVQIPAGRPPATLALGGQTIAGRACGVGIQVIDGGVDGLTISGPGTVEGFTTGILAQRGVAAIREVTASGNTVDGISLGGVGYEVRACEATRNGRDGFALRGRGARLDGNRALQNGRHGFSIAGREAELGAEFANEGLANARDGLRVTGRGHMLAQPVANENGGAGIRARISHGRIERARTDANGADGLRAAGTALAVADSAARDNGASGITVRGALVVDAGGNRAEGDHRQRHTRTLPGPECTVAVPCR